MTLTGVVFHCAHEFNFRFLIKIHFFVRLVNRSKVQQRKCDANCAPLEAFQTHLTPVFAVRMPPARPLVAKR